MPVTEYKFGTLSDGRPVTCRRLTSPGGAVAEVLDLGAALRLLSLPGSGNLTMGFDTAAEYEVNPCYAGVIVGRHAGRIGGGRFTLNGTEYPLALNEPPNNHHGGAVGFSHRLWAGRTEGDAVVLTYTSPHGEEGFPGTLTLTVTYQWTEDTTLSVTMDACCDRDTVASFTHHGYWNLSGEDTVEGHTFCTPAETFVAGDANCLPTGELPSVPGTPFDFRAPAVLGKAMAGSHPQLIPGCGFDHTFPVPGEGLREMGRLAAGGVELTVSSTLPGLHLYTGKEGWAALEAQFIPDAVHNPHFPSTVLPAGQWWQHTVCYRFTQV